MKLQRILVPTDFSEEANYALETAIDMAKKSGATISLLHVVDVPAVSHYDSLAVFGQLEAPAEDPEIYTHYTQKLLEVVKTKMARLKEEHADVKIEDHIEFDSLQRHLAAFVTKNDTDLIIMGSSGASGLDEVFVGSNAEKVIRFAKAPVLIVKNHYKAFDAKNIVFASNFKKISDKTLDSLKSMQKVFDATLHFVKIITPNTFEATPYTLETIENFANEYKFENYKVHSFNYFSEEEGIRAFGEYIDADLISLTTHGRTGIGHLLLGSIAEEVANHANLPVLTFNQHFK